MNAYAANYMLRSLVKGIHTSHKPNALGPRGLQAMEPILHWLNLVGDAWQQEEKTHMYPAALDPGLLTASHSRYMLSVTNAVEQSVQREMCLKLKG